MLEGLDGVPWHSLRHAYGPATDVPDCIRDLLSDNSAVREQARSNLLGNIWHQGTIYEVTPHAVPFLIELVSNTSTPERHEILVLLAAIYQGRPVPGECSSPDVTQDSPTATQVAVAQGAHRFDQLLFDPQAGVRVAAAYLLGLLRLEYVDDEVVIENVARAAEL